MSLTVIKIRRLAIWSVGPRSRLKGKLEASRLWASRVEASRTEASWEAWLYS